MIAGNDTCDDAWMAGQEQSSNEHVPDASSQQVRKVSARVHYPDGSVLYEPLVENVVVGPDGVRRSSPAREDVVVDLAVDDAPGTA